ncbi:hypothetical protein SEUCBS139899_006766 [Sporothrix eucalyptigena]|uniref:Uncharacterized protein n=1 Tax=Sporothrix eucalyptigena TaxID=1812306 RepID=A0ABP0CZ36_9PEZI
MPKACDACRARKLKWDISSSGSESSRAWTETALPVVPAPSLALTTVHPSVNQTQHDFSFFLHTIYATWPIIHADEFRAKLRRGEDDLDFQLLVHALDLLQQTYLHAFLPTDTTDMRVRARIAAIDQRRCTYDYAETATADTVVVSLALFVACIVLNKNKRALLYLSEAGTLADIVTPRSRIEAMRIQRLQALVFITGGATGLLTGDAAWERSLPQTLRVEDLQSWYDSEDDEKEGGDNTVRDLDRYAVRQLRQMTRTYMARQGCFGGWADLILPDEDHTMSLPGTPTVRITTADVRITQLWFSCERRPNNTATDLPESIGRQALAWARSLAPNELRIVGLGKMVDIVASLVQRCGSGNGLHMDTGEVALLATDLMAAIGTADYEGKYTTALAECQSMLGAVGRDMTQEMYVYVENLL